MNKYKKHAKREEVEHKIETHEVKPPIVLQTSRVLEPTVTDDALLVKETEKIKPMNAEIASASFVLEKKQKEETTHAEKKNESAGSILSVPLAIIIAGVLVAGSILWNGSKTAPVPKDAKYVSVASQLKKGSISEEVGLNKKDFIKCLESNKYAQVVETMKNDALKANINGTPNTVIVTKAGKKFIINGAYPIEEIRKMIESALAGNTKDAVEVDIPPVSETDHVSGSRNAELMLIEYSDTECPYSKRHHQTMLDLMKEYGPSGKVAWVYRHLAFHDKAPYESQATECANELGGNDKFWEYLDLMFKVTPANNGLDAALL